MTPVSGSIEHYRPAVAPSRHPESATSLMLESDRRHLNLLKNGSIDDIFNARSGGLTPDFRLYDDLNDRQLEPKPPSESGRSRKTGITGTEFDATEDNLDTRSQRSNSSADSMRTAHSLDKLLRTIEEREPPEQDTSGLRRLLKPFSPAKKQTKSEKAKAQPRVGGKFVRS